MLMTRNTQQNSSINSTELHQQAVWQVLWWDINAALLRLGMLIAPVMNFTFSIQHTAKLLLWLDDLRSHVELRFANKSAFHSACCLLWTSLQPHSWIW